MFAFLETDTGPLTPSPVKIILLTRCWYLIKVEALHQNQFFTLLKQSNLRGFVLRSVFGPHCTVTFLTLEQTRRQPILTPPPRVIRFAYHPDRLDLGSVAQQQSKTIQ
jgi:hypothetical protein